MPDPRLPPGPRWPVAAQSLAYGLDPYGFFARAAQRFGSVFTVRVLQETWVVLGDPAAAREVFAHGPDELTSGEANLAIRPIIGTRNVLLLDGLEHLRRRRLVLPPFHGDRMREYGALITAATRRELARWPRQRPLAVLPRMQAITFEVILRAVFGVEEADRLERLRTVLRQLLSWTTDIRRSLVFALLGPERLMAMRGFRRQLAAVDAGVLAEIRRRRSDPRLTERADVLSMLLGARDDDGAPLSDLELRDELVTLLVAGHETTAALLAWAVHELSRAREAQSRLAAAADGYADAVVDETLRLRPPFPVVVRRLRRPLRIVGVELPTGATGAPCAVLIHHRPDVYPDPHMFRPERFVGVRPSPGTWLPFGGGVRRCIGAAFARFEARIVLTELAATFCLRPERPGRERVGRRGVVLVPGGGARTIVAPR
jgi:cytochrome P450 family 135